MYHLLTESLDLGDGRTLTLETGKLAKQAHGSIMARLGDTMVLCTACYGGVREGMNFFPLSVDYREYMGAGGKFPGGFIKREGRPSEKEILSGRLIDRCLRPMFPDGFYNEVQVLLNVFSADGENDADVVAGVGASAALMFSGAPFQGPVGEVRVGRVNGNLILYPTVSQMAASDLNLVVAGTESAILMVEGEMQEIAEEDMMAAIAFGHDAIKKLCRMQHALLAQKGEIEAMEYQLNTLPEELISDMQASVAAKIENHLRQPYDKKSFYGGLSDLKDAMLTEWMGPKEEALDVHPKGWTLREVKDAFEVVEKEVMRNMILSEGRRLDGRTTTEIRPIWTEVDYLPCTHGSAIFTRGETQVMSTVVLGTAKNAQLIEGLFEEEERKFYLHYTFPPYSTGEAKMVRGVGRREIGHGKLAERAIAAMLPSEDEFAYTIRIHAEVLESNGSSSMATVCSGTLALMDAGVPMKKPVAGIAMGLITDGARIAVLSDILGTEDHLGDMDFKVTGTADGITACQMDIKIDGLSQETLAQALQQAKEGRLHILGKMAESLSNPRADLKPSAPRLTIIEIPSDTIGAVIGPGGKIIQGLQRETGTEINIEEKEGKGIITIAANDGLKAEHAIRLIKEIVAVPEVGQDYDGTVIEVKEFGPIVEIMPGKSGLLHVSEMSYTRIENAQDIIKVGDKITVRLMDIDGNRLRLSRKPFLEKPEGYVEREYKPRPQGDRPPRRDGGNRPPRRDDRRR